MKTIYYYLFYFCLGVINAVAIQMLPLFLSGKNFDINQITTLLSFVFLAALFQPIIGFITSRYLSSVWMLRLLLIMSSISALLMYFNYSYSLMIFLVIMFSVTRLSFTPIFDSYSTGMCNKHGGNYGLMKSGASLGFGSGMLIFVTVSQLIGATESFAMIFLIAIMMMGLILMGQFKPIEQKQNDKDNIKNSSEDVDDRTNWFLYLMLVLVYTTYFGGLGIRMTYLSSYYLEFDYTLFFVSLTTLVMVIPEIIFMPLYNRIFGRFNKAFLLMITIVLGIIQAQMYVHFHAYPLMLVITSLFNGLQIMIFFPTFFMLLQKSLGAKNSASGFLINMTIQSIFVGLFNQLVIKPIYISTGTTLSIYYTISVLMALAFIPLFMYYLRQKKLNLQ